jgi:hypothetical protein
MSSGSSGGVFMALATVGTLSWRLQFQHTRTL